MTPSTPRSLHRTRGWRLALLWLWCCLAWLPAAHAADIAPLVLPAQAERVSAWPATTLLADPSRTLDVQAVLGQLDTFVPPPRSGASLGVRKEAIWLRVPVVAASESDSPWILNINFAVLNEVDVYVVRAGQVVQTARLGNLRPPATGQGAALNARTPTVVLDLAAGQPHDLLIRVQTGGAMILPISLTKASVLLPAALREQMVQGLLNGLALCLVIYSLVQWYSHREPLFLFYALLVTGSAAFSVQFFGIGSQYLWSGNLWMERHAASAAGLLALTGSFLFKGHALMGHMPHSRFLRAMQAGGAITLALCIAFLLDVFGTATATAIISVVSPLPALMSMPIAIKRVRRGDRVSAALLMAWAAYFAAAVVMVGLVQGKLPVNFWTLHSFQIGATVDMLLFLRVLALRNEAVRHAAHEAVRDRDTMRSLAYTDMLTGLPNRRGLQMALRSALPRATPQSLVAVYLLDLDGFKPVNDTHGHDVGDDLLVAVGHRLQSCLPQGRDMVARLGGDEFLVLVRELPSEAAAHALGQQLLSAFEEPFTLSHLRLPIGLTIGYAVAPTDGNEPQVLLRMADAAMYDGKQQGKNRLVRAGAAAMPLEVAI